MNISGGGKILYSLTSKVIEIEGKTAVTYGISCDKISLDDISTDVERVRELVDKCNRNKLSPTHIFDVVEDFLNE